MSEFADEFAAALAKAAPAEREAEAEEVRYDTLRAATECERADVDAAIRTLYRKIVAHLGDEQSAHVGIVSMVAHQIVVEVRSMDSATMHKTMAMVFDILNTYDESDENA